MGFPELKLSRRSVMALAALGGATGGGLVWWRAGYYPGAELYSALRNLSPRQAFILAAVFETMLPPHAARDAKTLATHVHLLDAYLTGLPPADIAQFGQLLTAIEQATPALGGHWGRFTGLAPAARSEVLAAWQSSGFELARLGFRSLKALVFLVYYRESRAWRTLGYEGPVIPGGGGSPEVRAKYDALLAPPGSRPR